MCNLLVGQICFLLMWGVRPLAWNWCDCNQTNRGFEVPERSKVQDRSEAVYATHARRVRTADGLNIVRK